MNLTIVERIPLPYRTKGRFDFSEKKKMLSFGLKTQLLALLTWAVVIDQTAAMEVTNSTIERRQLGDGFILPLKSLDGYLGIVFRNRIPELGLQDSSLKMLITSSCRQSNYFATAPPNSILSPMRVSLGIKPLDNTIYKHSELVLNGKLRALTPRQEDTGGNAMGQFCVKSIGLPRDPFRKLMAKVRRKRISFWFGSVDETTDQSDDLPIVAEMGIGTLNERRMGRGSAIRFELKSMDFNDPNAAKLWKTKVPVPLKLNREQIDNCDLSFLLNIGELVVPQEMFQMIVKPLKLQKQEALSNSLKGIPETLVSHINEYADTKKMRRFDCKDVLKLPDLQFGQLRIPRQLLSIEEDGQCFLVVTPSSYESSQTCNVFVGSYIIEKFHFSVDFTNVGEEFVQFASRKLGRNEKMSSQSNSLKSCISKGLSDIGCAVS